MHTARMTLTESVESFMIAAAFTRVPAEKAADVCRLVELKDEALELLQDDMTPLQFVDRLVTKKRFGDAIKFLAYALPKPEAVWWGCLCLRLSGGDKLPPAEEAALQAAVAWVVAPTDETRQAALPASKAAGKQSPAGFVARAAHVSGGSGAGVAPSPTLTARTLSAGLLLAVARGKPEQMSVKYRQFLALGIHVAKGKYLWQPPTAGKPDKGRKKKK